jgi:hypothetical protein
MDCEMPTPKGNGAIVGKFRVCSELIQSTVK